MSEKFNLKWNDFQSNASKSFGLFRNESYLHDVTLVSDDFKQIPAHKLVLSATSEYFKNILQQTKQSQPLICLDGVNSDDLQNVLDYVYDGEVKIHQEDLDRFLAIAERLKLDGLLSNENEDFQENEDLKTNFEKSNPNNTVSSVSEKRFSTKNYLKQGSEAESIALTDKNGDFYSDEDHKQRLQDNLEDNEDGTVSCKICGRNFQARNIRKADARKNARSHVEIHIEGLVYTCTECSKTFRSKNSLNFHVYKYHQIVN